MARLVSGSLKDSEEDESGGDRRVENTEEDEGWDHERERNFLENFVAQRSKRRGGVVLISSIDVNNSTNATKYDDLCNGHSPQRLGEVLRLTHLSNETWNGDLTNEGVADV